MNTMQTQPEREIFKVLFRVDKNEGWIFYLSHMNFIVRIDPTMTRACAYFDNTQDYNFYKERINN